MTKRLQGKVALITGAAQGIGEAIATLFAAEGAYVIISDIQDAKGKALAKRLGAAYHHLDVSQEPQWESLIAAILKDHAHLDILVNNAGITGFQEDLGPQDPEQASLESWHRVHAVNMDGVFLGCKHAIRAMKKSHAASIVNISSRSGLVGIPGAAAYASSKAAIRNHTKTVALYCQSQSYPIRCNSIHPAAIITPMWDPMLGEGPTRTERMKAIAHDIPMQRMGTPQEVAEAALFLASEASSYITGIELTLDGGLLAGAGAPPKV